MKNYLLLILIALVITSCLNQNPPKPEKIEVEDLVLQDSIGRINDVTLFENKLLLLDITGQIHKVDLEKKEIEKLEIELDSITSFYSDNQSIFICQAYKRYYEIKKINNQNKLIVAPSNHDFSNKYQAFDFIYEDENFRVTSCCVGEWGGSIFFEDKETNIIYSTESTCVVNIDTSQGTYYIYNNLSHLSGSSSVIKISDVKNLPILDQQSDYWCNWYYYIYDDGPIYRDSLKTFFLGETPENKVLLDTLSIRLIFGGVKNSKPFVIYSDDYFLKLGSLIDKSIIDEKIILDSIPESFNVIRKTENKSTIFVIAQPVGHHQFSNRTNMFNELYLIEFDKQNFQPTSYRFKIKKL